MKIKKISQAFGVIGKVLSAKSTSTKDTYSCDYLNKKVEVIGVTEAGTDVNNYTETGIYFFNYANSPTNGPYNGLAGWLEVITRTENDIKQIWHVYNNNNLRYERIRMGGTWSDWVKNATMIDVAPNVMSASLKANYKLQTSSTYETIPLDDYIVVGDKLTLVDGKIKIGAGVSKILISARVAFVSIPSGQRNIVIRKNGTNWARVWHRIFESQNTSMVINDTLIEATEGDLIDLAIYGTTNDEISAYFAFTALTVEVVA